MKKILKNLFIVLLVALTISFKTPIVLAQNSLQEVYLGGMSAGFYFKTRGATVVGTCNVITDNGHFSPCLDAGICVGDNILSIDNVEVNSAKDVENNVKDDKVKVLKVERKGEILYFNVYPCLTSSGEYKLGVFIRDGINGIGTVSYITKNTICCLGHPVLNDNGSLLNIMGGEIYNCNITGCVKGERGKPGELRGVFIKQNGIAKIIDNCYTGVYGVINKESINYSKLTKIETSFGHVGEATIKTTIDGCEPKEYNIAIVRADKGGVDNKNYVIKITDKTLLEVTGGIVQGMSGSPIIQDGKLVGAVTHVFVNDPTRGFGISFDNMANN